MRVHVIEYGAIVKNIYVADHRGQWLDCVLGFDTLDEYLGDHPYFGACIGRYANRIEGASFELNGREYSLTANHGKHNLHGGPIGFDRKIWRGEILGDTLVMHLHSPDGDQGFPGNLDVRCIYELDDQGSFTISYEAICDQDTPICLTNHSYFNLDGTSTVSQHHLQIQAEAITEIDQMLIPTGSMYRVADTAFDFRHGKRVLSEISKDDPQLRLCNGYDHNFVLDGTEDTYRPVARLWSETSGIQMDVSTTEPGLQLFTHNEVDVAILGKGGSLYGSHAGLCLETQKFPDSVHHAEFPDCILRSGEAWRSKSSYHFQHID